MTTQNLTKVYSAISCLQAIVVEEALEKAGIPVEIHSSANGYDAMVPSAQSADAIDLLNPEPRSGEIYYDPSYPVYLTRN